MRPRNSSNDRPKTEANHIAACVKSVARCSTRMGHVAWGERERCALLSDEAQNSEEGRTRADQIATVEAVAQMLDHAAVALKSVI